MSRFKISIEELERRRERQSDANKSAFGLFWQRFREWKSSASEGIWQLGGNAGKWIVDKASDINSIGMRDNVNPLNLPDYNDAYRAIVRAKRSPQNSSRALDYTEKNGAAYQLSQEDGSLILSCNNSYLNLGNFDATFTPLLDITGKPKSGSIVVLHKNNGSFILATYSQKVVELDRKELKYEKIKSMNICGNTDAMVCMVATQSGTDAVLSYQVSDAGQLLYFKQETPAMSGLEILAATVDKGLTKILAKSSRGIFFGSLLEIIFCKDFAFSKEVQNFSLRTVADGGYYALFFSNKAEVFYTRFNTIPDKSQKILSILSLDGIRMFKVEENVDRIMHGFGVYSIDSSSIHKTEFNVTSDGIMQGNATTTCIAGCALQTTTETVTKTSQATEITATTTASHQSTTSEQLSTHSYNVTTQYPVTTQHPTKNANEIIIKGFTYALIAACCASTFTYLLYKCFKRFTKIADVEGDRLDGRNDAFVHDDDPRLDGFWPGGSLVIRDMLDEYVTFSGDQRNYNATNDNNEEASSASTSQNATRPQISTNPFLSTGNAPSTECIELSGIPPTTYQATSADVESCNGAATQKR